MAPTRRFGSVWRFSAPPVRPCVRTSVHATESRRHTAVRRGSLPFAGRGRDGRPLLLKERGRRAARHSFGTSIGPLLDSKALPADVVERMAANRAVHPTTRVRF